jgi:tetratricopeptide (TPR) repeat protein
MMGRPQPAIDRLRQAVDMDPENATGYRLLSWAYDKAGMESDFIAADLQRRKLAGASQLEIDTLRRAYREGGRSAFDQQRRKILKSRLESLQKNPKTDLPGPITLAAEYAAIGDADSSFHYLDQAYSDRSPQLPWIKSSIAWESLRNDPRYHNLIGRMNLPD